MVREIRFSVYNPNFLIEASYGITPRGSYLCMSKGRLICLKAFKVIIYTVKILTPTVHVHSVRLTYCITLNVFVFFVSQISVSFVAPEN